MFDKIIFKSFLLFFVSLSAFAKPLVPIETWKTTKGTSVFYVHAAEIPMVDIQLIFDAGSARDGQSPGVAFLTNEMLSSGSSNKSADDIAIAFDNIGAVYSNAVNRDMAVIGLRSLTDPKFIEPALATFTDVIAKPTFPNDQFLRIQKQTLNLLQQQEEQPSSIASKTFYNTLYDDNPYGHPIVGNTKSISAITAANLKGFYQKHYTANNLTVVIVGAVDKIKAQQIAENISNQLSQGSVLSAVAMDKPIANLQVKNIKFPSNQTHILIGQLGIKKSDPDYFPLTVGNYVLGGGTLTSRLFDQVREKRGLAYDVRSQFLSLKDRGPFIVELQTRNTEAENAINIVNKTMHDFIEKGPTTQEIDSAKKNLTQGFILKLASNAAIAANVANIAFYHLPINFLDTYKDNIRNVQLTQVNDTFRKLFATQNWVTVTVGDSSTKPNDKAK